VSLASGSSSGKSSGSPCASRNVKLHLDWREKLAGNARPGSGPALTLAGDF
jgi:hypothetical protein